MLSDHKKTFKIFSRQENVKKIRNFVVSNVFVDSRAESPRHLKSMHRPCILAPKVEYHLLSSKISYGHIMDKCTDMQKLSLQLLHFDWRCEGQSSTNLLSQLTRTSVIFNNLCATDDGKAVTVVTSTVDSLIISYNLLIWNKI